MKNYVIVKDGETDLTKEGYVGLAVYFAMIWAAQTMGQQYCRTLDMLTYRHSVPQRKQSYLNEALRGVKATIRALSCYDDVFDKVFTRVAGEEIERTEAIQRLADDVTQLCIFFLGRSDSPEARQRMIKAVKNFKQLEDLKIDDLARFFKAQL